MKTYKSLFTQIRILISFKQIIKNQKTIMEDLSRLQAAAAANTVAVNDAIAYIKANQNNQPAIDAVAGVLEANTAAILATIPVTPVVSTPVA